jgi:transketolase
LIGGSADLTGSNLTKVKNSTDFQHPSTGLGNYAGTYIRYGVREHGMGAIANGIAAYGGAIPYVATFLVSFEATFIAPVSLMNPEELRVLCIRCRPIVRSQPAPCYLGR